MASTPSLVLDSAGGALVCASARVLGRVEVGRGAVIHPHCILDATAGTISIGQNSIVQERAVLTAPDSYAINSCQTMNYIVENHLHHLHVRNGLTIGRNCVLELDSEISSSRVGDGTVIEAKAICGELIRRGNTHTHTHSCTPLYFALI